MRRAILLILMLVLPAASWAETGRQVPRTQAEVRMSYAPVVQRSAPAVVNIYATRVVERRLSPFADDPFFSRFFENYGEAMPRVQNSLGSGVIVASDGIVVSNYHVVQEATEIRVVLADRREFSGRVLLSDEKADIAVIRLEAAEDLPALDFADSDAALVGDMVLAIGNPFGVGQTVSSGIVSATARTGSATGQSAGYFIQTDAPINPGNSGGALVDMTGRLLGLNTSILTRSGGSNGIGFAIPSNLVAQYVQQATEGRPEFIRPWSGILVQQVDGGLAAALGLTPPSGVLVTELHPQSPFAAAGVVAGDVILSIAGLPVNAAAELEYRLLARGVGREVTVGLLRDGTREKRRVAVSAAPGDPDAQPLRIAGRSALAGLLVAEVTPRLIDRLGLPLSAEGVLVLRADGPSAHLGLLTGDLLMRLNGETLANPAELQRAVGAGQRVRDLELSRNGRRLRLRLGG